MNINLRAAELRCEAATERAVHPRRSEGGFSGLEIHIGRVLILVGRTLGDERSPRPMHF